MSAAKYVLLAEVFYQRQEDGSRKRYRTGDVVTGLSGEQVERLLKAKAIGSEADLAVEPEPVAEEPEGDDGKPGEDATKPELVEWIYANVAKADGEDYTKTELRKLDPAELRSIVDSV